jgi:hypothetical protein
LAELLLVASGAISWEKIAYKGTDYSVIGLDDAVSMET